MKNHKINYSRLVIGSAQFGSNYGISNNNGIVPKNEVENILEVSSLNNIDMLDTAISYGEAQTSLGLVGVRNFKVITKIPALKPESSKPQDLIEEFVCQSIKQLGIDSLYGVLLHDSKTLLGSNSKIIYKSLKDLQSKGLIQKIGISSYSPEDIFNITDRFELDIVQAPMNLIDRRMETSGCLKYLKENNIEIHIRSIFLQGLLLMPYKEIPREFERWSSLWKSWTEWLDQNKSNNISTCLAYPLSFNEVDKVIVGIESVFQLKQILENIKQLPLLDLPNISSSDEKLINPSLWKKKSK